MVLTSKESGNRNRVRSTFDHAFDNFLRNSGEDKLGRLQYKFKILHENPNSGDHSSTEEKSNSSDDNNESDDDFDSESNSGSDNKSNGEVNYKVHEPETEDKFHKGKKHNPKEKKKETKPCKIVKRADMLCKICKTHDNGKIESCSTAAVLFH